MQQQMNQEVSTASNAPAPAAGSSLPTAAAPGVSSEPATGTVPAQHRPQLLELLRHASIVRAPLHSNEQLSALTPKLLQAFGRCARRSAPVVFFVATGLEADTENIACAEDPEDAAPNQTQPASAAERADLDDLVEQLCELPKLCVAFVAGRVCSAGFALVASCEVVIAARDSEFYLLENLGLRQPMVPATLLRQYGGHIIGQLLEEADTIGVGRAQELGLVSEVVEDAAALQQRYEKLRAEFAISTATAAASLRWTMRRCEVARKVGSKRLAAEVGTLPSSGRKYARLTTEEPQGELGRAVLSAFDGLAQLPPHGRHTLTELVVDSLAKPEGERCPSQVQAAALVREALMEKETVLDAAVRNVEALLDGAEAERHLRVAEHASRRADIVCAKGAVAEKKGALAFLTEAVQQANASAEAAQTAEVEGNVDLDAAREAQKKLEEARQHLFKPLKEGSASAQGLKKKITTLVAVANEFNFESTMMVGLPEALRKKPEARTKFDDVILQAFEAQLVTRESELDLKLTQGEPGREQRGKDARAACDAVSEAQQRQQDAIVELRQANKHVHESENASKSATEAVHAFQPQLEELRCELCAAKRRLEAFRQGPLAAYRRVTDSSRTSLGSVSRGDVD